MIDLREFLLFYKAEKRCLVLLYSLSIYRYIGSEYEVFRAALENTALDNHPGLSRYKLDYCYSLQYHKVQPCPLSGKKG